MATREPIHQLDRLLATLDPDLSEGLGGVLAMSTFTLDGRPGLPMRVHLKDSHAYTLGDVLVDVDRELRRTERYLATGKAYLPRQRGPVEVVSAEHGDSVLVLLWLGGTVANLLLSRPVQVSLALSWFWEHRPGRWGSKRTAADADAEAIAMQLVASAQASVDAGTPTRLALEVQSDGAFRLEFASGEAAM